VEEPGEGMFRGREEKREEWLWGNVPG